jgi:hypothetical protein
VIGERRSGAFGAWRHALLVEAGKRRGSGMSSGGTALLDKPAVAPAGERDVKGKGWWSSATEVLGVVRHGLGYGGSAGASPPFVIVGGDEGLGD